MDFTEFIVCVAESEGDPDKLVRLLRQRGLSDEECLRHMRALNEMLVRARGLVRGERPGSSSGDPAARQRLRQRLANARGAPRPQNKPKTVD